MPGYQSDHRPARAGRAAEIRRDHQAQRRAVYGVCLEWGVSRDEKIRSRKAIKECRSKKQGRRESPPTPNDGVHFTSRVRMCVIAVDDGFNSYRN